MIGNSLTQDSRGDLAAGFMHADSVNTTEDQLINPASSLTQTVANLTDWQTEFAVAKIDWATFQPYPGASTLLSEQQSMATFVAAARAGKSPNAKFFIYEGWPAISSTAGSYQTYWDSAVVDADNTTMIIQRAAFDALLGRSRANITSNFWVIPTGAVMRAIDVQARAGNLPGISTVDDIHRDDKHMGDVGRWAASVTTYCTLQKKALIVGNQWKNFVFGVGTVPLTSTLAQQIADIVWSVVSTDPRTGVTP